MTTPKDPSWLPKIFPTYYMIGPIITVTQQDGGWSDVTGDLAVLIVMALVLTAGAAMAAQRIQSQPA